MIAKIVLSNNLMVEAIGFRNEDIHCEIEMAAGDDFESLLYESRYAYDTAAYLGPVSPVQSNALSMLLNRGIHTILDIGSGSGYIAEWLISTGFDVTACEIDLDAIEMCRRRGIEKIYSGTFLDLKSQHDAAILMGGSINTERTENLRQAVELYIMTIKDLVKHDGFLLTDLSYYHIPSISTNQDYKVSKIRFGIADHWTDYSYHIYPHPNIFAQMMTDYGFEILDQSIVDLGSDAMSIQTRHYSLWRRSSQHLDRICSHVEVERPTLLE
ncbi:class I SAM-dependent methyltransferase [Deinococcus sp. QL22]|uniref:class I SAM-dependent methyltransferase n=1 Tax=Deinococcus sp. QL22 TaxID=2939437 RepID=UPI002017593D|nr:class I SAM-dependent methyltransferase [Deinococcus sp. QL22]UQN07973.1 class I SAM-dependent methyltransferase [Deinococcus sp. QL22]